MKVVHCKREPYDIYIGRPSKWGNKFVIGKDGTRAEVVKKYEDWLFTQPDLLKQLPELEGKTLGCWCYPQLCHGMVLITICKERKHIVERLKVLLRIHDLKTKDFQAYNNLSDECGCLTKETFLIAKLLPEMNKYNITFEEIDAIC